MSCITLEQLRIDGNQDLSELIAHTSSQELLELFATMWGEIRASHLIAGQPCGDRSNEGVSLGRLALSIAEATKDSELEGEAQRMMAYALNANEQYSDSIAHYLEALKRLDSTEGKQELAARTRLGLIAALQMCGRYAEALEVGELARQWFSDNGDEPGLAKVYTNLGNVYHRLDDHAQSFDYHEKARVIFAAKGDKRSLAMSGLNIGNALSSLDRFVESDKNYAASERLSRQMDMPELLTQAKYNRAYLHFLRGRFSDALTAFAKLRGQFTTQHSFRHAALCDLDEAEIYLQLNVAADAAMLSQRAMEAFKNLGMRYEHAKAMAFHGMALTQKSDLTEAQAIFRQSQSLFAEEQNEYWTALLDLYRAEIFYASRRLWEARSLAESARQRFAVNTPSKHVLSLILLGRIAMDLGQHQTARELVEEALKITREQKMPLLLFRSLAVNAEVLEKASELDQARTLYEEAANELELSRSYLERDDLRVAFVEGKHVVYESLSTMALNAVESSGFSAASIVDAFSWCERSKARGLIDLLSSHVSRIEGSADQSLLNRVRRLHEELNSHHVRSSGENRPAHSGKRRAEVDLKENELTKILGELSDADPEYVSLQKVTAPSLESIQASLPENTTLVEYLSVRDEIVAFVIDSKRANVVRRLCPVGRIEHLQECLQFQIERFQLGAEYVKGHEQQLTAATQQHLRDLYESLISPIREHLETANLIIVPHGVLHYVPFHALFDGERYLVDHYAVSCAPSASVLKYCLDKRDVEGSTPLMVGLPDQNAPQIRREVEELSRIFPESRRLDGRKASRKSFRRESASADFVHIATHAVFRKDNPMFSSFKLGDGWISALDLYGMTCDANLITLSGCSSGMQQVAGGDDLLGLVRGFLYAGARSLLLSLWPVHDESTSQLMNYFYTYWSEGSPKAVALQRAMIRLREDFPHPFFWAPFVLVGKP